jgi:hypothetical protein
MKKPTYLKSKAVKDTQLCFMIKRGSFFMNPFRIICFYSDFAGPCFGFASGFVIF